MAHSGRVDPAGIPRGRENVPCTSVQVQRGKGGRHGHVTRYERPYGRGVPHYGKTRQTRAGTRRAARRRA
jgi:hypothetical protein